MDYFLTIGHTSKKPNGYAANQAYDWQYEEGDNDEPFEDALAISSFKQFLPFPVAAAPLSQLDDLLDRFLCQQVVSRFFHLLAVSFLFIVVPLLSEVDELEDRKASGLEHTKIEQGSQEDPLHICHLVSQ